MRNGYARNADGKRKASRANKSEACWSKEFDAYDSDCVIERKGVRFERQGDVSTKRHGVFFSSGHVGLEYSKLLSFPCEVSSRGV